jgi:hypothetical protein
MRQKRQVDGRFGLYPVFSHSMYHFHITIPQWQGQGVRCHWPDYLDLLQRVLKAILGHDGRLVSWLHQKPIKILTFRGSGNGKELCCLKRFSN